MWRVEVASRIEVSRNSAGASSPGWALYPVPPPGNHGQNYSPRKCGIAKLDAKPGRIDNGNMIMQTPYKNRSSSQSDRVSTEKLYHREDQKTRKFTPTDLSGTAGTLLQHNPASDKNMKQLPLRQMRRGGESKYLPGLTAIVMGCERVLCLCDSNDVSVNLGWRPRCELRSLPQWVIVPAARSIAFWNTWAVDGRRGYESSASDKVTNVPWKGTAQVPISINLWSGCGGFTVACHVVYLTTVTAPLTPADIHSRALRRSDNG
jgi:hypothetical protein